MSRKIKRCPFCGSTAIFAASEVALKRRLASGRAQPVFGFVVCNECHYLARSEYHTNTLESEQDAAKLAKNLRTEALRKWNEVSNG